MKQYQKPLLTVETLFSEEDIAFNVFLSGEGARVYDDED